MILACRSSKNPHIIVPGYVEQLSATQTFAPAPDAYHQRTEVINHYVQGYSTPVFSPTGGMKISATDLAKYMTMHMNYGKYKSVRIITKKSARIMQDKVSDGEVRYGLALYITHNIITGKLMVGHTEFSVWLIRHGVLSAEREVWDCCDHEWLQPD